MNLYEAEVHIYFDGNAEPSIVRYLIEADEIRDVGRTAEKLADDSCSVNPSSVVCMRSHRVALPYRFPDPPPKPNRAARRAKK